MILTCPACATSYFIADDLVGPNGRKVRCKSCGEVWKASNDEPLELTVAPEPVVIEPDPEVSLAETPAPELPKAFRARAEQQRRLRRAAAQGIAWAGMASVFVGLVASAWLFRVEVVEAFPRAAAAYAMVGSPVNPVGLDFEAMSAKEAANHPGMVLVSGALRNVRDGEIVAPPVRVALLDAHGAEIGHRVVRIDAAPVLPGKVQGFAALIPDPGGHAADISVNFAQSVAAHDAGHGGSGAGDHAKSQTASDHGEAADKTHAPGEHASASAGGLRPALAPGHASADQAPVDAHAVDDHAPAPAASVDKGHH